jgi:hypothetical protein
LDVDPKLIEKAKEYLQGRAGDRLSLVEAFIMDME